VPAYAYPPPYLEVAGPHRKFLENAVSIRGPGWMDFVLRSHGPLERFLFGDVGEEAAARRLGEITAVLQS
jgi:hypothetical protein